MDVEIIKEIPYQEVMDWHLAEKWLETIPKFDKRDPTHPEWKPTPNKHIDLSKEGYGDIYVKDESDSTSNPNSTIKDRVAWELTGNFRDYATLLNSLKKEHILNGNIGSVKIPRLSYVSAGNVGKSTSFFFKKYNLPPLKILLDKNIPEKKLNEIKELYADIYVMDLSEKPLTPEDIKRFTNNKNGIDITSITIQKPHEAWYDWHVHESYNTKPDNIFIPYGSGRLFENYLTWIFNNFKDKDPRLAIELTDLCKINIIAATPHNDKSIADKLSTKHNPFIIYKENDISSLKSMSLTGKQTGIYEIEEEYIKEAYRILSQHVSTEPSGSAGLAQYMKMHEQGLIKPGTKNLIINTGKGI